jgi:hypothetical protein
MSGMMTCFLIHLLTTVVTMASASITNCASYPRALPVNDLFADPPSIVAARQLTTFRVQFTVPNGTWVPYGQIEVKRNWNGLALTTVRTDLAEYIQTPLYPDFHTFETRYVFPASIWGRVSTEINVYNASGSQLLCALWVVYATGTDKNETGWPYSVLFA